MSRDERGSPRGLDTLNPCALGGGGCSRQKVESKRLASPARRVQFINKGRVDK